jgi:hypothetical protein
VTLVTASQGQFGPVALHMSGVGIEMIIEPFPRRITWASGLSGTAATYSNGHSNFGNFKETLGELDDSMNRGLPDSTHCMSRDHAERGSYASQALPGQQNFGVPIDP